jgi:hypothetical protein
MTDVLHHAQTGWNGISQSACPSCHQMAIILASVSQVARITSMSDQYPALLFIKKNFFY